MGNNKNIWLISLIRAIGLICFIEKPKMFFVNERNL